MIGRSAPTNAEALPNNIHLRNTAIVAPPLPSLELRIDGEDKSIFEAESEITVRVLANPRFLRKFPLEAHYMIDKISVIYVHAFISPQKIAVFSGSGIDAAKGIQFKLGVKMKDIPDGARIYLVAENIYQINSENKRLLLKMDRRDRAFALRFRLEP